jgi:hypothetical protein
MESEQNRLVEVPSDAFAKRQADGTLYVYKRSHPKKGTKIETVMIGAIEAGADSKFMLPNSEYFKEYNIDEAGEQLRFGATFAAYKVAKNAKLLDSLADSLGRSAHRALYMALHMLHKGIILDKIEEWSNEHYFMHYDQRITTDSASYWYGTITKEDTQHFIQSWVKRRYRQELAFFDTIASYALRAPLAEAECVYKNPQVNFSLVCDEKTRIPLFFSLKKDEETPDEDHLASVIQQAFNYGIKDINLFLDSAFATPENFSFLTKASKTFSVLLPTDHEITTDVLKELRGEAIRPKHFMEQHGVFCYAFPMEVFGLDGKMLIFYDAAMKEAQRILVDDEIKRTAELLDVKDLIGRIRFRKYFMIKSEGKSFSCTVNPRKLARETKHNGYFVVFSNDMNLAPEAALKNYKVKALNEYYYKFTEKERRGNKLHSLSEKTREGKTFVMFISFILKAAMLEKLSGYLAERQMTLVQALDLLETIKIARYNGVYRLVGKVPQECAGILEALGCSDIKAALDEINKR